MPVSTPTQPQSSQLGRDALLVHGLALVFAAGAVAMGGRGLEDEYLPAVVVGATAAFVLLVWSVILAVRALWRGQRARWPAVVLAMCGLEAAAVCLLFLWGARHDSVVVAVGLPVFVPVFVLASFVGVAVAWWRVRRAEKRELDAVTLAGTPVPQGAAPWPRQRRWKRGVRWYAAVTVLALAVLLPCPLFLFCAYTGNFETWESTNWRKCVVEHTPVVVGEASASVLSSMKGAIANDLYSRALSTGCVSQERLLSELSSTKGGMGLSAIRGLFRAYREAALEFATRLADGKVQLLSPFLLTDAGEAAGHYGTTEEIRRFLDPARTPQPPPEFLEGLVGGAFWGEHRLELVPDMERLCQGDRPIRARALYAMARRGPPEEIKRVWPGYLADTDPLHRAHAIYALSQMSQTVKLEIIFAVLKGQDRVPQGDVLTHLGQVWRYVRADRKVLVCLIRLVLPMLEDKDLDLRRAATWVLSEAADTEPSIRKQCQTMNAYKTVWPIESTPPDSPGEQELVKKVRDAAVKWLQDNDK